MSKREERNLGKCTGGRRAGGDAEAVEIRGLVIRQSLG
jgi:hypothetical protein